MATQGWEKSDFPILCESCLGPNPYVRMMKDNYGNECKVCLRPFTVFKWSPGVGERWKKTEICQTCAKIKNACQTCILDLEYGLHTRERDEVLGTHNSIPMSDVNTQVYVRKMEAQIGGQAVVNHGKAESAAKQVLKKLVSSQSAPYSVSRGKGTICAFYARGNCKRSENGGSCPFVHEMPEGGTRTRKAGASTSISKAPDAAAGEEPKTLSIKEAIAVTPAPAGSASDHAKYPSQNPNMLGTSTRSFRN